MDNRALTPTMVLSAYAAGFFPMADDRDSATLHWIDPEFRGHFPLDEFHVPRRLRKRLRDPSLKIRVDHAFADVVDACASPEAGRDETWINQEIRELYIALHHMGQAHSIEVYEHNTLIGGLYGVRLGRAFFGESMFSLGPSGSKIALVHTAARLNHYGFTLFDCQFWTSHLDQFGCTEIPRDDYQLLLRKAVGSRSYPGDYPSFGEKLPEDALDAFVQPATQTS